MMTEQTFAARLRQARDRAGLTQQQLADAAGVGREHVAHLETGKRTNPTLATLRGLARALGVGIQELAGR